MIGGVWGCEGGRGYVVVREGKGMGYEGGRGCGVMREGVVGGEGELPWVRGSGVLWVWVVGEVGRWGGGGQWVWGSGVLGCGCLYVGEVGLCCCGFFFGGGDEGEGVYGH